MYQSRACCPGKLLMSSMSFDLFIRAHTPHALLTKYTPEYNDTVLCSAPVRSTTATELTQRARTHTANFLRTHLRRGKWESAIVSSCNRCHVH